MASEVRQESGFEKSGKGNEHYQVVKMFKEVVVHPLPEIRGEIRDVQMPIPKADEIIIKVVVAGSNVKDWDHITNRNISVNSGDDIAGYVFAFGTTVQDMGEFRINDRVAAFHPMLKPGGAYAEYAVAPYQTVFHIPRKTSFEEAATLPLVTLTAALTLYKIQALPPPWSPRTTSSSALPLLVYGASSSLGCYIIKLARASNVHPLIAIAGGNASYVISLLDSSKGDTLIDYRQGPESMKSAVRKALGGSEVRHAVDCISAKGTWIPLAELLGENAVNEKGRKGQLSVVSGANRYEDPEIPEGVQVKYTYVGMAHDGAYLPRMPKQPEDKEEVKSAGEFAYVFFRYLTKMLVEGRFEGHPFEVVPGGLGGVEVGLRRLKSGKTGGKKMVYRIGKTEGF